MRKERNIVINCSLPKVDGKFPLPIAVQRAIADRSKPVIVEGDSPCYFYNLQRPGMCGDRKCPFINPTTGRLHIDEK